jgi:murein endopeptidase
VGGEALDAGQGTLRVTGEVALVPDLADAGPFKAAETLDFEAEATAARNGTSTDDDGTDTDSKASQRAANLSGEVPDIAAAGTSDGGWQYTLDLTDQELAASWREHQDSLGSISMGVVENGRLVNGVPFPSGEEWIVIDPPSTHATQETIDFLVAAIRQVKAWYPEAPPLAIGHISAKEGGHLRPHLTHQNGRDVDLNFYYPKGDVVRVRERERVIDVALNWALVKALLIHGDVQFILLDQRVQRVLYTYAKKSGEDPGWLDSLFHAGRNSVFQHASHHRDHFHVRYFNARAQELGRRLAPLVAGRAEDNVVLHRVEENETLGTIAARYRSSVGLIKKANRLRNRTLSIGSVVKVPLRRPCSSCPVPPATFVPPRRLPPSRDSASVTDAAPVRSVLASSANRSLQSL